MGLLEDLGGTLDNVVKEDPSEQVKTKRRSE